MSVQFTFRAAKKRHRLSLTSKMTHFPTLPYFSHSSLVSTSRSSSTSPAPTMFWKTKNKLNSLDGVFAGDCSDKSQMLCELWPWILQKLKSYRRRQFPIPKTRELHNLKQCWFKVTACTPGNHSFSRTQNTTWLQARTIWTVQSFVSGTEV